MASDKTSSFELFKFKELSDSLGAVLYSFANPSSSDGFSSVSIDSRNIHEGALFTAISGGNNDGHSFVSSALKNGAAAALVESQKLETFNLIQTARDLNKTLIVTDNSLHALQNAARLYLEKFPGLIKIGITGSSGKTTIKEILSNIISKEKNVVMNPGNYNSETGLPLAVFNVRPWHEAGIFEMAMNHRGEMAALASILKPDIALISNVTSAHIGNIGSIEGIAEEKKQIFLHFNGKCTAIIPQDCPFRDFLAEGVKGKIVFYSRECFAELGEVKDLGLQGTEIAWDGQKVLFPLPGSYNFSNAIAAISIAKEIPVSSNAIRLGLETVKPLFGRGAIVNGKITVIWDCYNSNPQSLERVLEFCENLNWQGRLIYVIGEMLELGEFSQKAHSDIGKELAVSKADFIFLFGEETKATAETLNACLSKDRKPPHVFHTCDMDELSMALGNEVTKGDLLLVKGSRACHLEKLSSVLEGAA